MKKEYRYRNIYTFPELLKWFKTNPLITIQTVKEGDFRDWESLLNLLYNRLTDVLKSHRVVLILGETTDEHASTEAAGKSRATSTD